MSARLTARINGSIALAIAWSALLVGDLAAAERLIDQQPYDLLTLKQDAQAFKLVPLEMERREPLREKDRGEWLTVRLLERADQRYQVRWRDIESVRLFEELVLEEALRLTELGDFDATHDCYRFIEKRAPGFPGLEAARNQSMLREAEHWLAKGLYANSLVLLNELYQRDKRISGLKELSGRVVDRRVEQYLSSGQHKAARELLDGLAAKFTSHDVVAARRQQLAQLGEETYRLAKTAADAGRLREAHELVQTARNIWPDSKSVQTLSAELDQKYPVVHVGVREPWQDRRSGMPAQWVDGRCRWLVDSDLFRPLAMGDEGARYESEIVSSKVDGRQTVLTVNPAVLWPSDGRPITSLDMCRPIAERMSAAAAVSNDPLAGSVESMRIMDTHSLEIVWKAECPLWQAMLQIPIRRGSAATDSPRGPERLGAYTASTDGDGAWRFVLREAVAGATPRQPRETSETVYRDTLSALRALRSHQIHVYDRIVPWDVSKVRAYDDLQLVPYASPTVHMLIANPNSALMNSGLVRRAVSLALDRNHILRDVLGDGVSAAGKALHGPFPLGYGCDASLAPPERDARRAAGLLSSVLAGVTDPSLTLVHGPDPVMRRGAEAIQNQLLLDGIGLHVKLVESSDADLMHGPSQDWDLWFVEWCGMEPLVDAQRLFGANSLVGRSDPALQPLVKALQQANTWKEAQAELHRIHRRVNQRLTVIGLWQIEEYAVIHRTLHGVGTQPFGLYQNIRQWQVKSP